MGNDGIALGRLINHPHFQPGGVELRRQRKEKSKDRKGSAFHFTDKMEIRGFFFLFVALKRVIATHAASLLAPETINREFGYRNSRLIRVRSQVSPLPSSAPGPSR